MAYFVLGSAAYMYIYISRLHPNHIEHCSVFHKSSRIASPMRMRMRTPCAGSWLVFSSGLFLSRKEPPTPPPRRSEPKATALPRWKTHSEPSCVPLPISCARTARPKANLFFPTMGPSFSSFHPSIHSIFFPHPIPSIHKAGNVPCRRRRLPPGHS